LKTAREVVTWGVPGYGGDAIAVAGLLAAEVQSVTASDQAFAALRLVS